MKQNGNPDVQAPAQVLIVDDEEVIRHLYKALLEADGHQVDTAIDAETAQRLIGANKYDVIVSDVVLPGSSGIDLLKLQNVISPDIPFVLVTGNPDMANASEAIRTGSAVDYLIKPVAGPELQKTVARAVEIKRVRDENRRLEGENQRYQQHLEEMVQKKSEALLRAYDEVSRSYDFTLEALVAMLDAREKSAGRHSIRVREFAMILADEMNVPEEMLDDLARGTLLHDIGKIAIPDCVLLKPGKLTDVEWAVMRNHPQIGYDIIRSSKELAGAAEIILSHHEKYDGSGYPRGLKGDEICLSARIFSVVDAYDAMRSVRVYKKAVPAEEALEEIRRCDGSLFDPEVVKAFMTCQPLLEEIAQWDALDQELPA